MHVLQHIHMYVMLFVCWYCLTSYQHHLPIQKSHLCVLLLPSRPYFTQKCDRDWALSIQYAVDGAKILSWWHCSFTCAWDSVASIDVIYTMYSICSIDCIMTVLARHSFCAQSAQADHMDLFLDVVQASRKALLCSSVVGVCAICQRAMVQLNILAL